MRVAKVLAAMAAEANALATAAKAVEPPDTRQRKKGLTAAQVLGAIAALPSHLDGSRTNEGLLRRAKASSHEFQVVYPESYEVAQASESCGFCATRTADLLCTSDEVPAAKEMAAVAVPRSSRNNGTEKFTFGSAGEGSDAFRHVWDKAKGGEAGNVRLGIVAIMTKFLFCTESGEGAVEQA